MTSPDSEIRTFLQTLVLGAPVYDRVPEGQVWPYIHVQDISNTDMFTADRTIWEVELLLDIVTGFNTIAGGRKDADTIGNAVLTELCDTPYRDLGNYAIVKTTLLNSTYIDEDSDSGYIVRKLMRFGLILSGGATNLPSLDRTLTLTLAQLEAKIAAETIVTGAIYKITDTGWLLLGTGTNTLTDADDTLTLANGDTLPTGVEPDTLLIDTGVLTGDYSGSSYRIEPPLGYFPVYADLISYIELTDFNFALESETIIIGIIEEGEKRITFYESMIYDTGNISIQCTGNAAPGFRCVIKYERSKL